MINELHSSIFASILLKDKVQLNELQYIFLRLYFAIISIPQMKIKLFNLELEIAMATTGVDVMRNYLPGGIITLLLE